MPEQVAENTQTNQIDQDDAEELKSLDPPVEKKYLHEHPRAYRCWLCLFFAATITTFMHIILFIKVCMEKKDLFTLLHGDHSGYFMEALKPDLPN